MSDRVIRENGLERIGTSHVEYDAGPIGVLQQSQCNRCRHRWPLGDLRPRCAAFPGGIPRAIYFQQVDHREPFPGDHGIRFEAMTEEEAAAFRDAYEEWVATRQG